MPTWTVAQAASFWRSRGAKEIGLAVVALLPESHGNQCVTEMGDRQEPQATRIGHITVTATRAKNARQDSPILLLPMGHGRQFAVALSRM